MGYKEVSRVDIVEVPSVLVSGGRNDGLLAQRISPAILGRQPPSNLASTSHFKEVGLPSSTQSTAESEGPGSEGSDRWPWTVPPQVGLGNCYLAVD